MVIKCSYTKFEKGYRFTISKGDCYTSALFEYPADTSKAFCDQKQREFIDFIINKWRGDHTKTTESAPISKHLRDTLSGHLMAYAVSHKIPCNFESDSAVLRMWYAGPGPVKGIVIVWDEVENIFELIEAVVNKLHEWADESDRMYITYPPRAGKSLYRHFLNAAYGIFSGKSQACLEYINHLIEKGEITMP